VSHNTTLSKLEKIIRDSFSAEQLIKMRITKPKDPDNPINEIVIRPVQLKKGSQLQFVYKESTRDITKNYSIHLAWQGIAAHMTENYKFLSVVTMDRIFQYDALKDRLATAKNKQAKKPQLDHDNIKSVKIKPDAAFLSLLGITSANGKVKSDKQAKFKQINRYIAILSPLLESLALPEVFKVVDMGSGKGYLTFALYQHLVSKGLSPIIKGIELRPKLVKQSNKIAEECGYSKLSFQTGEILAAASEEMDILIALHACDTATDDAIIAGVKNKAQLIVCSPCCHQQVRKDMMTTGIMQSITSYGILLERQAEILADTIRVLIMNYCGYKTKVIEYVSATHTPKNLLLVGIQDGREPDSKILERIEELKNLFGLKSHYLEKLITEL